MLGISLVWPKALVFEISITGSNPVSPAKIYSECSAVWLAHLVWDQGVVGSNPTIPTTNLAIINGV